MVSGACAAWLGTAATLRKFVAARRHNQHAGRARYPGIETFLVILPERCAINAGVSARNDFQMGCRGFVNRLRDRAGDGKFNDSPDRLQGKTLPTIVQAL